MRQRKVDTWERKITNDRNSNYRGTACVDLEILEFSSGPVREIDRKIVDSLKGKFKKEGCRRLTPRNYIPATIEIADLSSILELSGISTEDLLENPKETPPRLKFPPGFRLSCCHGRQRIEAAKEILYKRADRWWTVDLYIEDSNSDWQRELSEEYSNSTNFSDGEIYRKIRQYSFESNRFAEKKWWARLTKKKRDFLKRFLKHEGFRNAFDALLIIPAVLAGLNIGVLDKMIAMKCDEEIIHYLLHILKIWLYIFEDHKELIEFADGESVSILQLRAPGASREDLNYLRKKMQNGELFPAIRDRSQRDMIWKHLSTIDVLIPTIYSLFEDIKFLKPLRKAVVKLLRPNFKGTIREAMGRAFTGVHQKEGEFKIGGDEASFTPYPGNTDDQIWYGILQLWLFPMRHFDKLVRECPRKEEKQDLPVPKEPSPFLWYRYGVLADSLGFATKQISSLKSKNPDMEVAYSALLEARDPDYFIYDETLIPENLRRMKQIFDTAIAKPDPGGKPTLFIDGPGEAIPRRCGRVFENAYKRNRKLLFLRSIFDPAAGEGSGISSFFVRRSVFLAFFGGPPKHSPLGVGSRDVPPLNPATAMEMDRDQISPVSGESRNSSPTSEYSVSDLPTSTDPLEITEANPARGLLQFIRNTQPQFQESQMMIMPAEHPIRPTHQTEPSSSEIVLRRQNAVENAAEHMEVEYTQNQYIHTEETISFKLIEGDGRVVLIRDNCTRAKAEATAKSYVAARFNLCNVHGTGLAIATCFDAVLRDPERCVYLRRSPESANHQLVLSNTSVVVQGANWRERAQESSDDEIY